LSQKVLVTGAGGQLGQELMRSAPPGFDCVGLDRSMLDIGDLDAVLALVRRENPQILINAAAYTAVDKAESEPALARRVNTNGPANLARACLELNTRLLHVSTDFIFDGESSSPYGPTDTPAPVGEYGRGKLAGEREVLAIASAALIIRTGWVYSIFGSNFVKTMLRLMAERDQLSVVADQVGTPTWAGGLAKAIWAASSQQELAGIYHWSDSGVCSWYDFAVAINEEACAIGLLDRTIKIIPIPARDYPTPARRPAYSVLDKEKSWIDFQLEGVHWRSQLRSMLRELPQNTEDNIP
jgi:dTDP-4-dehydrorhamnose reductase